MEALTEQEIQKLFTAVLTDALKSIGSGLNSKQKPKSLWEDLDWLFSDEISTFSYLTICKVLCMNPTKMRNGVRKALRKCKIVRTDSGWETFLGDDENTGNFDLEGELKHETSIKNR